VSLLGETSASSALAKPFGAAAAQGVVPIQDTPCEPRVAGVAEMLGDDALKIGVHHGPVERPPFADDAVGERNPALGPFADLRKPTLLW
jgi:hypothetical protein